MIDGSELRQGTLYSAKLMISLQYMYIGVY